MIATQLPTHEAFRREFVSSLSKASHKNHRTNKRWETTFKYICAPPQIKQILINETAKHHSIGCLVPKNQLYGTYDHTGLIDAACAGANLPTYSSIQQRKHWRMKKLA